MKTVSIFSMALFLTGASARADHCDTLAGLWADFECSGSTTKRCGGLDTAATSSGCGTLRQMVYTFARALTTYDVTLSPDRTALTVTFQREGSYSGRVFVWVPALGRSLQVHHNVTFESTASGQRATWLLPFSVWTDYPNFDGIVDAGETITFETFEVGMRVQVEIDSAAQVIDVLNLTFM